MTRRQHLKDEAPLHLETLHLLLQDGQATLCAARSLRGGGGGIFHVAGVIFPFPASLALFAVVFSVAFNLQLAALLTCLPLAAGRHGRSRAVGTEK